MNKEMFDRIMKQLGSCIRNKPIKDYDIEDMVRLFNTVLKINESLSGLDLIHLSSGKRIEIEFESDEELVELYGLLEFALFRNRTIDRKHPKLLRIENTLKARDTKRHWDLY